MCISKTKRHLIVNFKIQTFLDQKLCKILCVVLPLNFNGDGIGRGPLLFGGRYQKKWTNFVYYLIWPKPGSIENLLSLNQLPCFLWVKLFSSKIETFCGRGTRRSEAIWFTFKLDWSSRAMVITDEQMTITRSSWDIL